MNDDLPNCVPQEQYKPDENTDDVCPHCGNMELKFVREYDDDDFFSDFIICKHCGYKEEL